MWNFVRRKQLLLRFSAINQSWAVSEDFVAQVLASFLRRFRRLRFVDIQPEGKKSHDSLHPKIWIISGGGRLAATGWKRFGIERHWRREAFRV